MCWGSARVLICEGIGPWGDGTLVVVETCSSFHVLCVLCQRRSHLAARADAEQQLAMHADIIYGFGMSCPSSRPQMGPTDSCFRFHLPSTGPTPHPVNPSRQPGPTLRFHHHP